MTMPTPNQLSIVAGVQPPIQVEQMFLPQQVDGVTPPSPAERMACDALGSLLTHTQFNGERGYRWSRRAKVCRAVQGHGLDYTQVVAANGYVAEQTRALTAHVIGALEQPPETPDARTEAVDAARAELQTLASLVGAQAVQKICFLAGGETMFDSRMLKPGSKQDPLSPRGFVNQVWVPRYTQRWTDAYRHELRGRVRAAI